MAQPGQRLPRARRLLYGSGTIAFGVKDQGFNALLMLFYNQVIGLPSTWVGAAIMIAMIADALFDPLLGQWSDNVRTRIGRRLPFMYAAALPIALSYFFLWQPPEGSHAVQFAYLLTVAIIVRMSISLYEIPSTALLAEFSTDYDERTRLVASRFLFGVLGGVAMTVLTFQHLLLPTAEQPVGHLNAGGYVTYAWIAALVMLAAILFSTIGIHKAAVAVPPAPPVVRVGFGEMMRQIGEVFTHRAYTSILLASLFIAIAMGLITSLSIYLATYFWELSASEIGTLTSASFVGILLAFVVVLPLSSRFGKKHSAMFLFGLAVLVSVTPILLRLAGHFPANGDPALLTILMVVQGAITMCVIAAMILAVSMVADVTDQIQLETGRKSEGLMFSAATLVNKAVSGLGIFMSGALLAFVGFPEQAQPGQVPMDVLRSLAIFYTATISIVSLLAIICLGFYPITRKAHLENIRKLQEQAG